MIARITKTALTAAALTTTAGAAHAACVTVDNLRVCGDWENVDGGKALSGDARIKRTNSNSTRFTLTEADLWYGDGGISGQASFALPSVAALGNGAGGELRGDVRIFTSAPADDSVSVNGLDINIEEGDSALVIDYAAGTEGNMGGVDISAGNDGTLVLIPDSRTFYIGGDFQGLPTGAVEVGALGVSLNGAFDYTGDIELYDGSEWFTPTVEDGHLYVAGTIPFGRYPIALDGRAFMDVTDDVVAAEGVVNLGYTVGGFDLTIPVAEGAVMLEGGDDGALFAAGANWQPQWFEGTPLAFLDGGQRQDAWAWFDMRNGSIDDFVIGFSQEQVQMAGFAVSEFTGVLSDDGISVSGSMPVHTFGTVEVAGSVQANGDFSLSGTAELNILGSKISEATITVTNSGVDIEGELDMGPLGRVHVDGSLSSNGQLSLTGSANLEYAGVNLSNADITVTNSRISMSANVSLPGFSARMSGTVDGGRPSLSARLNKTFGPMSLGNATFTFENGMVRISDTYSFAGQNFSLHGQIMSNGHLMLAGSVRIGGSWTFAGTGVSISGDANLGMHGMANGSLHFGVNASVKACAHVLGGKDCASKSGSIDSRGRVSIKFPVVGRKTIDVL